MITTAISRGGISPDGRLLGDPYLSFTYWHNYAAWWKVYLFRVEAGFYYGYEGHFAGDFIGFFPVPNINDKGEDKTGPFHDADVAVEDCLERITAFCRRQKGGDGAALADGLLKEIQRSRQEQARQLSLFEVSA